MNTQPNTNPQTQPQDNQAQQSTQSTQPQDTQTQQVQEDPIDVKLLDTKEKRDFFRGLFKNDARVQEGMTYIKKGIKEKAEEDKKKIDLFKTALKNFIQNKDNIKNTLFTNDQKPLFDKYSTKVEGLKEGEIPGDDFTIPFIISTEASMRVINQNSGSNNLSEQEANFNPSVKKAKLESPATSAVNSNDPYDFWKQTEQEALKIIETTASKPQVQQPAEQTKSRDEVIKNFATADPKMLSANNVWDSIFHN